MCKPDFKKTMENPRLQRQLATPPPWDLLIRHLKLAELLKNLDGQLPSAKRVEIGDRVTFYWVEECISHQCRIVDAEEASPEKGDLSHLSPLGTELVGRQIGDKISVNLFGRRYYFFLVKIQKPSEYEAEMDIETKQ